MTEQQSTYVYGWGIESSAESEAGMIAGGTGCGHRHKLLREAVDCLADADRKAGEPILNSIIAHADGSRLTPQENMELVWGEEQS